MTYEEAVEKLLNLFALNYQGKFDITPESRKLWRLMLRGAEPDLICSAAWDLCEIKDWPPTAAEVRRKCGLESKHLGSGTTGWTAPGTIWKKPEVPALPAHTSADADRTRRHLAILRQKRQMFIERHGVGDPSEVCLGNIIASIEAGADSEKALLGGLSPRPARDFTEPDRSDPPAPLRSNFAAAVAIAVVAGLALGWEIARPARRVARETAAVVASGFDFGEGYRMNLAAMSVATESNGDADSRR